MTGVRGLGRASGGLSVHLTPHQVGLCALLNSYAQGGLAIAGGCERKLFEKLLREVQAARGPRQKTLRELHKDLCGEREGDALWRELLANLRSVDSPDALFDIFQELEGYVARELGSTSPLHACGIFGQFARCCILAFKDSSFEGCVKLYDAVERYLAAYDPVSFPESPQISHVAAFGTESVEASPKRPAVGALQMEQLAHGLMHDLPRGFGQVPFPMIDSALTTLQDKLPLCHLVHLLRFVNSLHHRLADDAGGCLRSFHDGHQQRGLTEARLAVGWALGLPPEDGLPDLIQHASLLIAGLHAEMRQLDDSLQAMVESIRAAQETSDVECLCACLYMFSLVLLQAGLIGKAFTMMRRCLHRAEALGLPALQVRCCLSIAHALSAQPGLSDRRKRGLLWRESISRMAAETQPAQGVSLRAPGLGAAGVAGSAIMPAGAGAAAGAGNNGLWPGGAGATGSASGGSRAFGFLGGGGPATGTARGGLGVLAALLGHRSRDDADSWIGRANDSSDAAAMQGMACRDALAHLVLASQLSMQAGALGETRPKVLLCLAEVARLFGLQTLTTTSCGLALEIYHKDLTAEDRALALCQLITAAAERSLEHTKPLLHKIARQLPHAGHLWAYAVFPEVVHMLMRAGESTAASALLFQAAAVVRAAPHNNAGHASQRLRLATNSMRLYHRQLLPAHRSAREAVEQGSRLAPPGDICRHLLCLADVHLEARDPVGALAPLLRCLSATENARLLQFRAEALVRLARVKLDMRDFAAALQLAELVTPQLSANGSASQRGEALMLQADVLFEFLARCKASAAERSRLLKEIVVLLSGAAEEFEAVVELDPLRRCHYLLARACHQLGRTGERDAHAGRFRMLSQSLEGCDTAPGRADQAASSQVADLSSSLLSDASSPWRAKVLTRPLAEHMPAEVNDSFSSVGGAPGGQGSVHTPPGRQALLTPMAGPRSMDHSILPGAGEASPLGFAASAGTDSAFMDQLPDAAAGEEPLRARCPALAQLLHLVEDAHAEVGDGSPGGMPPVNHSWLFGSTSGGSYSEEPTVHPARVRTAIGEVRTFYPMTAIFGA